MSHTRTRDYGTDANPIPLEDRRNIAKLIGALHALLAKHSERLPAVAIYTAFASVLGDFITTAPSEGHATEAFAQIVCTIAGETDVPLGDVFEIIAELNGDAPDTTAH